MLTNYILSSFLSGDDNNSDDEEEEMDLPPPQQGGMPQGFGGMPGGMPQGFGGMPPGFGGMPGFGGPMGMGQQQQQEADHIWGEGQALSGYVGYVLPPIHASPSHDQQSASQEAGKSRTFHIFNLEFSFFCYFFCLIAARL